MLVETELLGTNMVTIPKITDDKPTAVNGTLEMSRNEYSEKSMPKIVNKNPTIVYLSTLRFKYFPRLTEVTEFRAHRSY